MKSTALYICGISLSVLFALIVMYVVSHVSVSNAIVAWDEASNMVWGYKVYDAIRTGDWRLFFELTTSQLYYPPLQSWFIGLTSYILGFSVTGVRIVNMLWLLVITPLIFSIGFSFRKTRFDFWAGLIAVALFLTSPLTLALSGIALKEIMGTALTLITFVFYNRLEEKNTMRNAVSAAMLMIGLFYFKYNYALFLCAGFGVLGVINFTLKYYTNLRAFAAFWIISIIGIGSWVLLHGQRLITVFVHGQTPQTIGIGTWADKILFFPKSVVFVYAPNVVVGLFIICAFFYALVWYKNATIRALWVVVLVYFCILGVYTDNLHERYVFPIMPLLYILASYVAVHLGKRLRKAHRICVYLLVSLGFFMGVGYVRSVPWMLYAVGAHALRSPIFNQPDYRDTLFDFNRRHWSGFIPSYGSQSPSDVVAYVFGIIGSGSRFSVVGNVNELSPKYWELSALIAHRSMVPLKKPGDYVVYVEVTPESRFYTRDYLLFNQQSTEPIQHITTSPEYAVVDKKTFPDIGINVILYKSLVDRGNTQ